MTSPDRPKYIPYAELPRPTEAQLAEGVMLDETGRHIELEGRVLQIEIGKSASFRIAEREGVVWLATPHRAHNKAETEKPLRVPHSHELVIGREIDIPGLVLPDTVSRFQFGIRRTENGVNIRDFNSKNGTLVRSVSPEELQNSARAS